MNSLFLQKISPRKKRNLKKWLKNKVNDINYIDIQEKWCFIKVQEVQELIKDLNFPIQKF